MDDLVRQHLRGSSAGSCRRNDGRGKPAEAGYKAFECPSLPCSCNEKVRVGRPWVAFLSGALVAAAMLALSSMDARTAEPGGAALSNPLEGRSDLVDEGRGLFNQYCSHCHGPNAIQGERPRDLRRLKLRYGREAPKVYSETVNRGRLDKGMPVWKDVLTEDALWRIFTYLQTVQTEP